ncbi:FAM221A/B family protein [archaeon]|nr:MAG: FAM221A/B family protein [archaeon]
MAMHADSLSIERNDMEEVPRARLSLLRNRVKLRVPIVQHTSAEKGLEDKPVPEQGHHSMTMTSEAHTGLDNENTQPQLCLPVGSNVQWLCISCNNECLSVTRESRCICGHRRKDHATTTDKAKQLPCASKSCPCKNFFYIVGEGSWILRCQCKHKHIEHNSDKAPYTCKKCPGCTAFDSPWVCNCGHRWNEHLQRIVAASSVRGGDGVLRVNHAVRSDGLV